MAKMVHYQPDLLKVSLAPMTGSFPEAIGILWNKNLELEASVKW